MVGYRFKLENPRSSVRRIRPSFWRAGKVSRFLAPQFLVDLELQALAAIGRAIAPFLVSSGAYRRAASIVESFSAGRDSS